MRHFVYEINERNLRVKLKDIEMPLKEGAWENFEEFSARECSGHSESGFKLKLSFNRNVLVLGFFGLVLVSFSLLLFNFITIKNPKQQSAQLEETQPVEAPAPVKKEEPKPVKPVVKEPEIVKDTTQAIAVTVPEEAAKQPQAAPVIEKPEIKQPPVAEKKIREEPKTEAPKRKRATASLARELRPAVITEDTEPDVRPN